MKEPAVALPVAISIFRKLSGFRDYPKIDTPGEAHFIEAFQESVISVEHARAVVKAFDGEMPTIREIRDQAFSLRKQFEPQVNERAEWERVYGKAEPVTVSFDGIPVRRVDELWRKIRHQVPDVKKLQAMSWLQLAKIARELGYEDYADAWERDYDLPRKKQA